MKLSRLTLVMAVMATVTFLASCGDSYETSSIKDAIYRDIDQNQYYGFKVVGEKKEKYSRTYNTKNLIIYKCPTGVDAIPIDCTHDAKAWVVLEFIEQRSADRSYVFNNTDLLKAMFAYAHGSQPDELKKLVTEEDFKKVGEYNLKIKEIEAYEASHRLAHSDHTRYEELASNISNLRSSVNSKEKELVEIQKLIDFGSQNQDLLDRKKQLEAEVAADKAELKKLSNERSQYRDIYDLVEQNQREHSRLRSQKSTLYMGIKAEFNLSVVEALVIKNPKQFEPTDRTKNIAWLLDSSGKRVYLGPNHHVGEANEQVELSILFLGLMIDYQESLQNPK